MTASHTGPAPRPEGGDLSDTDRRGVEAAFAVVEQLAELPGDDPLRAALTAHLRALLADDPAIVADMERMLAHNRAASTVFVAAELPAAVFYHDAERADWVMLNPRTLRGVRLEVPAEHAGRIGPLLLSGKAAGEQWRLELCAVGEESLPVDGAQD